MKKQYVPTHAIAWRSLPLKTSAGFLKTSAGFTLVEISLYLALISLLIVSTSVLFYSILDLQLFTSAKSVVETDSRYISARLMYDIKRANQVLTPDVPGAISSTLELDIDGKTHIYQLTGSQLEVSSPDEATAVSDLAVLVTDLSFKRLGSPSGTNAIKTRMVLQSEIDANRGRVDATQSLEFVSRTRPE